MKILLTDRALKAVKPSAKQGMIWDAAVPGFAVRTGKTGKLTFVVMRRIAGRKHPNRWALGVYPIMTLAEAREAATAALRDIAAGVDPRAKKEAERRAREALDANTFGAVAEEFIARHVRKLRSATDVEAAIRRELVSRWGARPVTDISRRDIVAAIEEIADSGRLHAAHNTYSYVTKLFLWILARGLYGLEVSPCAGRARPAKGC